MKAVHVIGILVFLLFMVGSASAETFYLTNTSEKINGENVEGIRVKVEFNGTHIIITDLSTSVDGSTADIKGIKLYLQDQYVDSVTDPGHSANVWTYGADYKKNYAGFGTFYTSCTKLTDSTKSRGPIVIALDPSFTQSQLPANSLNNSVIVHLGFGDNPLITVGEGEKVPDSSWIGGHTEIPEFPTIALPVAAVLGIMFVLGNKRKE
jgi:hypothetical protein